MAKAEAAAALKESMEIDGAATKGRWTTEVSLQISNVGDACIGFAVVYKI
jgi:hypothetical protein